MDRLLEMSVVKWFVGAGGKSAMTYRIASVPDNQTPVTVSASSSVHV